MCPEYYVRSLRVDGTKRQIVVAGLKLKHPLSPEKVLSLCREVAEKSGAEVAAVNPKSLAGTTHALAAAYYALRAFTRGNNISKHLPIEVLLYVACTREIRKALERASVQNTADEIVAISLGSEGAAERAVERLAQALNADFSEEVLKREEHELLEIARCLGISDEELGATYAHSLEEAVTKCILCRMALLTLV